METIMEKVENIYSENIQIFTTEEVIQNQVKNFIHKLMDEGMASPIHGWTMSDIVSEVSDKHGRDMASFAKQYIMNMCGY